MSISEPCPGHPCTLSTRQFTLFRYMSVSLPTFAELTEQSFFMAVSLYGMNITTSSLEESIEVALLVDEEQEAG
jgi:hypothetical protein